MENTMPVIPEDWTLEELRDFFAQDRFATVALGATILKGSRGHSICEMTINETHLNAMGNVMGGVTFTLADFALAVACNIGEEATVAINNSIQYMNTARGTKLIAECTVDKSGQTVGFYTVVVKDDLGTLVAKMTATCSRRKA
jgi:acyl-CoA thioesterase